MMQKQEYLKYVEARAKKSPTVLNCVKAFFGGGLVCVLGQGIYDLMRYWEMNENESGMLTSVILIFIAGLLTGFGWFDKIAKFFGAGVLVPITGFANAMTAPAIDAKSEGYITGIASQMFIIAGPVIVYGCAASAIYGVIYYLV